MTQLDLQQKLEQAEAQIKDLKAKQSRMYEKDFVEGVIAHGNTISDGFKKRAEAAEAELARRDAQVASGYICAVCEPNNEMHCICEETKPADLAPEPIYQILIYGNWCDTDKGEYEASAPSERRKLYTDAIKCQWMAEGAIAVREAIVIAEDGSDLYETCTKVAEQLRQPEEKGQ